MPGPETDRERAGLDSLDALEPMGPHLPEYDQVARAQALTIAEHMEDIFQNKPGIDTQYSKGVEKGDHRWALYNLLLARKGVDVVGRSMAGESRLDMLNRGLGPLQPVLRALPSERRAELATLASEVKRTIGSEIGDEVRDDPDAVAGAENMTAAAGFSPGAMVTKLSDVIGRGKAVGEAIKPTAELIDAEKLYGDVKLGKVKIPTAEGAEVEADFSAARGLDGALKILDLYEGYVKMQELTESNGDPRDAAGQVARTFEFLKVSGQIAKGVLDLAALTARGVARAKGATDMIQHIDGFLAFGENIGLALGAVEAIGGVFTLLSDTASDMDKADAVKNITVFTVQAAEKGGAKYLERAAIAGAEEGASLAAGGAAGTGLAATAEFLAHWGGPVAISIALTWEMAKWIGAETHEFNVTFSAFMMNHGFRTLAHHGGEISKHGAKLASLARRMEEEQDPDIQAGIHDTWMEETRNLAAEVKAVVRATTPQNDYMTPGAYWTIQQRFAGIRSQYAGVREGDEVVAGSIECLMAIQDVLSNADDYVERERQRDPSVREQGAAEAG